MSISTWAVDPEVIVVFAGTLTVAARAPGGALIAMRRPASAPCSARFAAVSVRLTRTAIPSVHAKGCSLRRRRSARVSN
jgi:hypothetical protein